MSRFTLNISSRILIFSLLGFSYCLSANGQDERRQIPTYHVSYDNGKKGNSDESSKSPYVMSLIRFHELDILGLQEGLYYEGEEAKKQMRFPFDGVEDIKRQSASDFSSLCYDPNKFELTEQDSFTLDFLDQRTDNEKLKNEAKRCYWGKFRNIQDGQFFYVFDIHYDTPSETPKEESKKLILEKIHRINQDNLPYILTGDFNVSEVASKNPTNSLNENLDKSDWEELSYIQYLP